MCHDGLGEFLEVLIDDAELEVGGEVVRLNFDGLFVIRLRPFKIALPLLQVGAGDVGHAQARIFLDGGGEGSHGGGQAPLFGGELALEVEIQ